MEGNLAEFTLMFHKLPYGRRGGWVRLTITDEWIEVRRRWPTWVPSVVVPARALWTAAADVEVAFRDATMRRGLTFKTTSGALDGFYLRPLGWTDRRAVHAALERHGYTLR